MPPHPVRPATVAARLRAALEVLPAMRERIQQIGAEAFPLRPEEFDAFLAADAEAAGRIARAANIKPQ